jgi:hypothetical protein
VQHTHSPTCRRLTLCCCLQVDLVFVDFTLNDGFEDAVANNSRVCMMERLMRKALAKPHAPAVVLMQVRHAARELWRLSVCGLACTSSVGLACIRACMA